LYSPLNENTSFTEKVMIEAQSYF